MQRRRGGWAMVVALAACDYAPRVAPHDHRVPDATTPVAEVVADTTPEDVAPAIDIPVFDPYGTPLVCSTGVHWTRGDHGSEKMHPGVACIACHANGGGESDEDDDDEDDDKRGAKSSPDEDNGPLFHVAGTVYETAHEPDDCAGAGPVQVIVTDATGREFHMATNEFGNFYLEDDVPFAMPYTARVRVGERERKMSDPQSDGDCNGCHSQDGTTLSLDPAAKPAPGRIMVP